MYLSHGLQSYNYIGNPTIFFYLANTTFCIR